MTWLLVFVIAPTALLWLFEHKLLWRYRITFAYCVVFALVFGISWDYVAITTGLWGWPESCCSLPWVWGLPLDELVFMVTVALYLCSLTVVVRQIYLNHGQHRRRR